MTTQQEAHEHLETTAIDYAQIQIFMQRVVGDLSGAMVSILCSLGDRLGLFQALAYSGPMTSAELAERTNIAHRYAEEWLRALVCAGYVTYASETQRYELPSEHAAVLASTASPMDMAGAYQLLPALIQPLDEVARAFRDGGGVSQSAYSDDLRVGMERISACWFDHMLVSQWIASLPNVQARLEQGAQVADIGCGGGRALIRLAQAFPRSIFTGYDSFAPSVQSATDKACQAEVADRVRFVAHNLLQGLPGRYDLITLFDSLHDVTDPDAGLCAVRDALAVDGVCLILEMNCAERLEDDLGPIGATLYATSVLYNLPVTRALGGEGVGTMGLPASRLEAMAARAGFTRFRRLPTHNPYNALYALQG